MKMPKLIVLLLTILVQAGSGFPTDRNRREKHASWDDVNVVAHGLLQLGQGLKEHVDKTKAQMRDMNSRLKAFNGTVAELERKQEEQGEALITQSKEGQGMQRLLVELGEGVKVEVGEVKRQTEDLTSRIDRLEEVLTKPMVDSNDSDHERVSFIQRLMIAQNRRIDQLVEKISQQQDKLEKQSLHLQVLQNKVANKRMKSHRRRDEEMALRGEAENNQAEAGLARDCQDLFARGQRASGIYTIQPENSKPFSVLCEMTPAGGWTVIQKRQDGSQNFNQLWESYRKGFGNLNGEFWLGLANIHSLSKQGRYVLQVELSNEAGQQQVARYQFQLDGEEKMFALHLVQDPSPETQQRIVSTGESGLPFSTADKDNDLAAEINCAKKLSGGWWFSSCGESNLNGKYPRRHWKQEPRRQAMFGTLTQGHSGPLRTTLLKIAPLSMTQ
ncbi:PREDICTED: angiopoietin-related protein 4-like [Cyprinodon variegatus]|uniref:Angiopoietin-related protein 4-like n=1 Tax=Cyprinodon variegatus TaxID=28743 RepID=A0A3Q2G1T1_CYPVA|nr:PREDICTED: angiopoietin-related protein 4-like [Cyprinodon variegatus]